MAVNVPATYILNRFDTLLPQKLVEFYYKKKLQQRCFLMKQQGKWTIVTVDN